MEVLYELWLHAICDFEPDIAMKVAPVFENADGGFNSSERELKLLREIGIAGEFINRFKEPEFFNRAKDIIKYCSKNQIRILSQDSDEYPFLLKNTDIAPRLLFVKGKKLNEMGKVFVSVVGCRKPSDQGKVVAFNIGKELAQSQIVTVSGMAEGIDGEAHRGALAGGGPTIAVLAGSVDSIYPSCHQSLYRKILENGAIVSERPPGTDVKRYFYQQRNRIVVGMSQGTIVVEGEEKSGTSISARLALENNRDVFAVPGCPLQWQSKLPNRLISEGAYVVDSVKMPAKYYRAQNPELFANMGEPEKEKALIQRNIHEKKPFLTDEERILKFLATRGGAVYIEEISQSLNLAPSVLSSKLMILSIKGEVRQESGNRYILSK